MIYNIFKRRFHVKNFNKKQPNINIIKEILRKTFECVPSKQLIVPYAVKILGPNKKSERKQFHDFCKNETDLSYNQIKDNEDGAKLYDAPYIIIFTTRFIDDLSESMKEKYPMSEWCWPAIQVPHTITPSHLIEIGMFSAILSGMCIENNLSSSFSLLFPKDGYQGWKKLSFINGRVLFCMSIGYTDEKGPVKKVATMKETRPPVENIIQFL